MYEVIVEINMDGKKIGEMKCEKPYLKKGYAERKAKKLTGTVYDTNLGKLDRRGYVRGVLHQVTEEEAKRFYCKNKDVWVDGKYGQVRLTPSGDYGSHASAAELFYRSIHQTQEFYCDYKGNYYIEED